MFNIIISIFFIHLALFAETSMFGAGDLESSTPYGLTKTEEVIVKNKKIVAKNEKTLKKTNTQVQDLDERVDGIELLLEGESIKLNKLSKSVNKNIEKFKIFKETNLNDINKNSELVSNLKLSTNSELEEIKLKIEQNDANIQTLKSSFDKIVSLVNEINGKYVTKDDFNKLISLLDKKTSKQTTKKKTVSTKKTSKELIAEGRKLFKKDYFTKAIVIFDELIARNYRPAESNYYLGEINYYRKNYKDALHYFKNSMTLYDKASYLPKLLLHSAISFEKLGDNDNAQNFYNTIVDLYPDTNEAKEASKKIKN